MVSAEILRHFTTDAEDSSHCHPLICMNHTTHHGLLYGIQTSPMKIIKSCVVILYSVNAINHSLANLQPELILSCLLKLHPVGMSVACGKGSSCSKSSSSMMDVNYLSFFCRDQRGRRQTDSSPDDFRFNTTGYH